MQTLAAFSLTTREKTRLRYARSYLEGKYGAMLWQGNLLHCVCVGGAERALTGTICVVPLVP